LVPAFVGKAILNEGEDEIGVEPQEMPCVRPEFQFSTVPDHEFINPTSEMPVKAAAFLGQMDMSCVLPVLSSSYKESKFKHYMWDPQAMLKALILRKLIGLRWYTDLERYLNGHIDEARMLGFHKRTGWKTKMTPDHSTFTCFERRIARVGMRKIMDILVIEIGRKLEQMGMRLGTDVAVDSTPIAGRENDPDAQFNPHYKTQGYKIHGAYDVDFGIPLAFQFTKINEGDSPRLIPLLDKLHEMGIEPREVFADGAYASLANLAVLHTNYSMRAHFNMRANSKENRSGTGVAIQRLYRRFWKSDGFNPEASIGQILEFLMNHGEIEAVGAYHWNRYVRAWKDDFDATKKAYNRRAAIEAFHGHMKQQMLLEKFMDASGLEAAERHVRLFYIALLAVALCRLQHGVIEGLSNVKCFN